jgi:hypothetical protein
MILLGASLSYINIDLNNCVTIDMEQLSLKENVLSDLRKPLAHRGLALGSTILLQ